MKKSKILFLCTTVALVLLFAACSDSIEKHNPSDTSGSSDTPAPSAAENALDLDHFYTLSVKNTGEDESEKKYLEIAGRSQQLFPVLEEKVGAFVVNAYNYQDIDGEGTPLYTMNTLHYPQEIDPNGESIRVSKNYFLHNPIEAADGGNPAEQFIYDDLTLNLLVPQKFEDMEDQIIEAWRENFYFEKVEATNQYNHDAGIDERLNIPKEDLKINIIYVKNGQRYFTFRSDCAVQTDHWIKDPIVQIYTSNIHCNYAHSFMTQWVYFYSRKDTARDAYQDIAPYVKECGAEQSIQQVISVSEN